MIQFDFALNILILLHFLILPHMVKAVFIDYMGTIITQGGRDADALVYRVCKTAT